MNPVGILKNNKGSNSHIRSGKAMSQRMIGRSKAVWVAADGPVICTLDLVNVY